MMYWKSEYSPDAPTSVFSPTRRMRRSSVKRAKEPYDPARRAETQRRWSRGCDLGASLVLMACRVAETHAPSVSAASMTPPLYLIASTDVPVTMGCLRVA